MKKSELSLRNDIGKKINTLTTKIQSQLNSKLKKSSFKNSDKQTNDNVKSINNSSANKIKFYSDLKISRKMSIPDKKIILTNRRSSTKECKRDNSRKPSAIGN